MRRIVFVFGTRPEAIKVFPVVHMLARASDFEPRIIVTAQHREMLDQVMTLADLKPDVDLDIMRPGQTLTSLTAAALTGLTPALESLQPDLVVVQGDTTTAFAGALSAFYLKVPVAHIEAGLRSGKKYSPYPEEINRRMVAQVTDIHLAPTERARRSLLAEGFAPETIHVTGNTIVDALQWIRARLEAEPALRAVVEKGLPRFDPSKRLVLVTNHRRENFDGGIDRVCKALARLADRGDVEIAFPVHLNPNVREPVNRILAHRESIRLLEPLDYLQFAALMMRANLVITDSGGVQEEAPALGLPVLVTRDTTERPEGVDAGTALLVGPNDQRIVAEATRLLDDKEAYLRMARAHNPFGDGQASHRIEAIFRNW
jgi:UDP-N-acetylglucosamine 2-epimerase (non-hydrolysing)